MGTAGPPVNPGSEGAGGAKGCKGWDGGGRELPGVVET